MPFCCGIGGGSHVTVAERELLATATKFCGYDVGTIENKKTKLEEVDIQNLISLNTVNVTELDQYTTCT